MLNPIKRLKVFDTLRRLRALDEKASKQALTTEMVITATNATAALYFVWQQSIGLTQPQINIIQASFTLVLLFFTFPTGWIADRWSRKYSNAVGDFTVSGTFVFMALFVNGFGWLLVAEIVQGLGHAISKGADNAMLTSLTEATKKEGETAKTALENARSLIVKRAPLVQLVLLGVGGLLGAMDYKYMFFVAAVPHFVGGVLSLLIKNVGKRKEMPARKPTDSTLTFMRRILSQIWSYTASELKGMWQTGRGIVTDDSALKWLMIAHAFGFKLYMPAVLVYGPLLLQASESPTLVVIAYVLRMVAKSRGGALVREIHFDSPPWVRFTIPSVVLVIALAVMLIPGSALALIIALMMIGFCEGWFDVVTSAWVQDRAQLDVSRVGPDGEEIVSNKKDVLSSVDSMSDTMAQAVYAILLFGVTLIAGDNMRIIVVTVLVVGLVALPVTIWRLKRLLPDGV